MPLRSVFCAAVDNDLEMCSNALRTCSELQGNKFVEPLQQRLSEQNKARDALKKRWRKELRRVSEAVSEHSATRILGPNLQSFPSHHS